MSRLPNIAALAVSVTMTCGFVFPGSIAAYECIPPSDSIIATCVDGRCEAAFVIERHPTPVGCEFVPVVVDPPPDSSWVEGRLAVLVGIGPADGIYESRNEYPCEIVRDRDTELCRGFGAYQQVSTNTSSEALAEVEAEWRRRAKWRARWIAAVFTITPYAMVVSILLVAVLPWFLPNIVKRWRDWHVSRVVTVGLALPIQFSLFLWVISLKYWVPPVAFSRLAEKALIAAFLVSFAYVLLVLAIRTLRRLAGIFR